MNDADVRFFIEALEDFSSFMQFFGDESNAFFAVWLRKFRTLEL